MAVWRPCLPNVFMLGQAMKFTTYNQKDAVKQLEYTYLCYTYIFTFLVKQ